VKTQFYKKKTNKFHDQSIARKELVAVQKVLLFNSRLELMSGKLHSHWIRPFLITRIYPYEVVEL